jgi:molecular chaperone GrpE
MPRKKTPENEPKRADQAASASSNPSEVIGAEVVSEMLTQTEAAPALVEIASLKEELAKSQAKAAEYLDGWQRSAADFSNYKRRIEREQTLNQQLASASVIKRFLEIFDDLERALKNRPQSGEASGWANGIELVYRKFLTYLETEGVQTIEAEGHSFDPNLHEAISQEDHPGLESGQIIGIVQQGYRLGDRVIRPARVRVAR